MTRWAIQVVEPARDELDAQQMLEGLTVQDGFLGGRVLPPGVGKPDWRVQGFFQDEPEAVEGPLPDGMQRVVIPPGQARRLGLFE